MDKIVPAIIEFDMASAERELTSAWTEYQKTEKYGMAFGEAAAAFRKKFKAQGSLWSAKTPSNSFRPHVLLHCDPLVNATPFPARECC